MVERFIRLLVEYDQKGQQIVREAQDQRREILDHMSDYKQEMSQQYRARCDHRIDYYKAQAEACLLYTSATLRKPAGAESGQTDRKNAARSKIDAEGRRSCTNVKETAPLSRGRFSFTAR